MIQIEKIDTQLVQIDTKRQIFDSQSSAEESKEMLAGVQNTLRGNSEVIITNRVETIEEMTNRVKQEPSRTSNKNLSESYFSNYLIEKKQ